MFFLSGCFYSVRGERELYQRYEPIYVVEQQSYPIYIYRQDSVYLYPHVHEYTYIREHRHVHEYTDRRKISRPKVKGHPRHRNKNNR